ARSQEALEALKKPLKTGEAPSLVTGDVKRAMDGVKKVGNQVKQVKGQIEDANKLIDAARAKITADMAEFSKTGNHLPGIDIHSERANIDVWENQIKAYQNNLKNKTAELGKANDTLKAAKNNALPKMQSSVDKLASNLSEAEKELLDVTSVSATQAKDIANKIKTNEDAIAEILSRRTYPPDSPAGIAQKNKLMREVDFRLTDKGLAMGKVNDEAIGKYGDVVTAAKKELAAFIADEKAYKNLVSETEKLKAIPTDKSVAEAQAAVAKAKAELDASKDALEAAKAKRAPVASAKWDNSGGTIDEWIEESKNSIDFYETNIEIANNYLATNGKPHPNIDVEGQKNALEVARKRLAELETQAKGAAAPATPPTATNPSVGWRDLPTEPAATITKGSPDEIKAASKSISDTLRDETSAYMGSPSQYQQSITDRKKAVEKFVSIGGDIDSEIQKTKTSIAEMEDSLNQVRQNLQQAKDKGQPYSHYTNFEKEFLYDIKTKQEVIADLEKAKLKAAPATPPTATTNALNVPEPVPAVDPDLLKARKAA
ncbi:MAG: hypothetical protein ACOYMC_15110, partial [Pirellulales bacterium]